MRMRVAENKSIFRFLFCGDIFAPQSVNFLNHFNLTSDLSVPPW